MEKAVKFNYKLKNNKQWIGNSIKNTKKKRFLVNVNNYQINEKYDELKTLILKNNYKIYKEINNDFLHYLINNNISSDDLYKIYYKSYQYKTIDNLKIIIKSKILNSEQIQKIISVIGGVSLIDVSEIITQNKYNLTVNDFKDIYFSYNDETKIEHIEHFFQKYKYNTSNKYFRIVNNCYRSTERCYTLLKHFLTKEDIITLLKNNDKLKFNLNIMLDIIDEENKFLILDTFKNENCVQYSKLLDKVKSLDETDTKWFNYIMDILNCQSSKLLVKVLDMTKLNTDKKQEIILLRNGKSCNL